MTFATCGLLIPEGVKLVSAEDAAATVLATALIVRAGQVDGNAAPTLHAISSSMIVFTGIAGVITLTSAGG